MPKRQKQPEPVFDESKRWLDSYADVMTLLLAFFIMMFAFSLVDETKFTEFRFGVSQALGKPAPATEGGAGILNLGNGIASNVSKFPTLSAKGEGIDGTQLDQVYEVTPENLQRFGFVLKDQIVKVGAEQYVTVETDPRGLVIKFENEVLFSSGDARIHEDGRFVLDLVADVLDNVDNNIVVEGHTDNLPHIGHQMADELGVVIGRATTVLRYLVELKDVAPVRMSAAGYADTRPRSSNDTVEGRQQNRRVELVVLVTGNTIDAQQVEEAVANATAAAGDEPLGSDADSEDAEADFGPAGPDDVPSVAPTNIDLVPDAPDADELTEVPVTDTAPDLGVPGL